LPGRVPGAGLDKYGCAEGFEAALAVGVVDDSEIGRAIRADAAINGHGNAAPNYPAGSSRGIPNGARGGVFMRHPVGKMSEDKTSPV